MIQKQISIKYYWYLMMTRSPTFEVISQLQLSGREDQEWWAEL